jgi:hypothetical protein
MRNCHKNPGYACFIELLKYTNSKCSKQSVEAKKRKQPRVASISKDANKKIEKTSNSKIDSDLEVYGSLDASHTLLLHGLESDFIEEQMADDEVFRLVFRFCRHFYWCCLPGRKFWNRK